jgi:hypothetical protein
LWLMSWFMLLNERSGRYKFWERKLMGVDQSAASAGGAQMPPHYFLTYNAQMRIPNIAGFQHSQHYFLRAHNISNESSGGLKGGHIPLP